MNQGAIDSQEVVNRLAQMMQSQGMTAGDRLPSIRQLASMMKVSPSIIRDAMVRAQAMGVIKLYPRSGAFVQSVTCTPAVEAMAANLPSTLLQLDQNVIYLLDTRRVLEIEAVTVAAERRHLEDMVPVRQALESMNQITSDDMLSDYVRADIDFHLSIARAAGNPVLLTVLKSLFECIEPFLMSSFLGAPWNQERRQRSMESHCEIYQSIIDKDVERARHAINEHLSLAREKLINKVQQVSFNGENGKSDHDAEAKSTNGAANGLAPRLAKPNGNKPESKSQRNRIAI